MIAIIAYTITGIYILMVILFTIGWLKTPTFKPNKSIENPLVSLVVCCKNEAQNLPHLYKVLNNKPLANLKLFLRTTIPQIKRQKF